MPTRCSLFVQSLLMAGSAVLGSRCNGAGRPGPRNLIPIDDASPVFIKEVPNGKLFHVGQGDDTKDLIHVWGTPYENGLAMGQLIGTAKFTKNISRKGTL